MSVGVHFRGWFFAAAISLILLIIVAVPPAYANSSSKRSAFVGTMIPVATALYFLLLYTFFHRPLQKGIEAYKSETHVDTNGFSKELRKVDAAAAVVLKENETLRRFLSQTVGDSRVNHGMPITPRQEHNQPSVATPATVGRPVAPQSHLQSAEPSPARIRRKKNCAPQPPPHKAIDGEEDDGLVLHSLPETPCAS